jgi:hypothetical protein
MSLSECFEMCANLISLRRKCVEPKRRANHSFQAQFSATVFGFTMKGRSIMVAPKGRPDESEYARIFKLHS